LIARVRGRDVTAMQAAPLSERIDDVVTAAPAEFRWLLAGKDLRCLRKVLRTEDGRPHRGSGGHLVGFDYSAAERTFHVFADAAKTLITRLPNPQRFAAAGGAAPG